MSNEDPQKTWTDYYQRKRAQRLNEAAQLWKRMQSAGVNDETVLVLDFVHFGPSQPDVASLAKQLSENYTMEVVPDEGAWLAKGTTRPDGITLNQEQHLDWVAFMAEVAQSYACVFSTWSFEVPSLNLRFQSEQIPDDA